MTERIFVSPGGMEMMRSDVATTAHQTLAVLDELIGQLEPLKAGFSGEAALAFAALKDAYAAAKMELATLLGRQAQQVADAADQYRRADLAASTYF